MNNARSHPSWRLGMSMATAALSLAGCASTSLDAQWSDPQMGANPLRGAKVLVACEAYEMVIREDQVEAYQAYLTLYPAQSLAPSVRSLVERRREMIAPAEQR